MHSDRISCKTFVRALSLSLIPLVSASIAPPSQADVVVLGASQDNTLYEDPDGSLSNGAGDHMFVGRTNGGELRRAVVAFDVGAAIPPGSVVNSVTLTLYMSRTKAGTETVGVRVLLADWGEGASHAADQEGGGAPSAPNDATWKHTFYPSSTWGSLGGDYSSTVSASTPVSGNGSYTWSGAGLVADVQAWVDNPATNFGWILIGNESQDQTAKRFDTHENGQPSRRPELTVDFTPAVPQGACCFGDGTCSTETAADCAGLGGAYQGDGTSCFPNPCVEPTGACCFDDTSCQALTAADCLALGGTYQGDGSDCATTTCPLVLEPFVDALPIPGVAQPVVGSPGGAAEYEIRMLQFTQKLHRDLPPTTVWGYEGGYPGPLIEAFRDQPVQVKWINDLRDDLGNLLTEHYLPVDTCMHGPDTEGNTPRTVVHLHGGHVAPQSDGYPEWTILPGEDVTYDYPNGQLPATLWFHDHALGITRLNVYMGLAGLYLIRDQVELDLDLPDGEYEIPLVIQDRNFNPDGTLDYPAVWQEQAFGDKMLVNGKVWPYLDVKRGLYRFRLLNGCNSRTLTLSLSTGTPFDQIGTDGGLLPAPVPLTEVTISPGERADVVIDFGTFAPATEIVLTNSAPAPYPGPPGEGVVEDVMKFVVLSEKGDDTPLPATLRPLEVLDEADAVEFREFVLRKDTDPCSGSIWLINGLHWDDITEYPKLGTTEVWSFINDSGTVHPMHMHLVFFQILDRQPFDLVDGQIVPTGPADPPPPNEAGWKDTVQTLPNEITRVIARFEGFTGRYPYHCHILEHEDHEMMRQFEVIPGPDVVFYGCGVNPDGSLTLIGGSPTLGSSVTFGIDNPLGTQAVGSLPVLGLALAPDPSGPPCGTPIPGFGMAGGGAPGELLISVVPPNPIAAIVGPPWAGVGMPSSITVPVPDTSALIGTSAYVQGVMLDFSPGATARIGLTTAAEIQIGP